MVERTKKYYSPYHDEGTNIKHIYPISRLARKILCAIRARGVKATYAEPLPEDLPLLICPNHACDFGPIAMDKVHKRKSRVWSVDTIIRVRSMPMHLIKNVCNVKSKWVTALLFPIACLLSIPMACIVRSQQPIPVYYDARVRKTFEKSALTLNEGLDIVLYPEWKDPAEGYRFVNQVKTGVAYAAKLFVEKYHKPVGIVPVYVCESLKKVMYGHVKVIEKFENFKKDSQEIAKYIMDEIESMANTLPPHRITPYDATHREDTGLHNLCAKADPV